MRGERQRRLPVSARLQHHSPFPRQVARAEPGGWMVIEKAAVYPEPLAQYPQVHILYFGPHAARISGCEHGNLLTLRRIFRHRRQSLRIMGYLGPGPGTNPGPP